MDRVTDGYKFDFDIIMGNKVGTGATFCGPGCVWVSKSKLCVEDLLNVLIPIICFSLVKLKNHLVMMPLFAQRQTSKCTCSTSTRLAGCRGNWEKSTDVLY